MTHCGVTESIAGQAPVGMFGTLSAPCYSMQRAALRTADDGSVRRKIGDEYEI
jgi:hypothetical protein